MYRAKNHNWEPRQGIPSFQRVSSDHYGLFGLFHLYQWKVWNLYSSLTMNNGKLIRYFRSHLYAIVSDMAHFLIPFGMRERNGLFRTVFHLYWCKIKTFGIFTAQWLWIMGKQFDILQTIGVQLCQILLMFTFYLVWENKWPLLNYVFYLCWHKSKHLEFLWLADLE